MRYLPFIFGIAEVVAFVAVASLIGVGWTLLIAVLTSVVGFLAFRREGIKAWASLRESVAAGAAVSQDEVRDRMVGTGSRMVAAILLMLPGFLTDMMGVLLLMPAVRTAVGQKVAMSALRTFPAPSAATMGGGMPGMSGQQNGGAHGDGSAAGRDRRSADDPPNVVIEGEVVDTPTDDPDGT